MASTSALRAKVWTLLFQEWDADRQIKEPREAPKRSADDSTTLKVGYLTKDAEPASRKRKAGESTPTVPAHRRSGAAVYMKVQPH